MESIKNVRIFSVYLPYAEINGYGFKNEKEFYSAFCEIPNAWIWDILNRNDVKEENIISEIIETDERAGKRIYIYDTSGSLCRDPLMFEF